MRSLARQLTLCRSDIVLFHFLSQLAHLCPKVDVLPLCAHHFAVVCGAKPGCDSDRAVDLLGLLCEWAHPVHKAGLVRLTQVRPAKHLILLTEAAVTRLRDVVVHSEVQEAARLPVLLRTS